MKKEARLNYLKDIKKQVEQHRVAREIDLEYANEFEMKEAVADKNKDQRKLRVLEVKNYITTIKQQIEKDDACLVITDRMIKETEEKLESSNKK